MRTISLSKTCEWITAETSGKPCGMPRIRIMGYSDGGRGDFFDRAECGKHAKLPRDPKFAPLISAPRTRYVAP